MPENPFTDKPILVLGATGYIGGRLVPLLLDTGYRVRAAARSAEKIRCRPYGHHERLEVVTADVRDPASLTTACSGCAAAFYLVHSMDGSNRDFVSTDLAAAENMALAAKEAGLEQIIYLGGMGDHDDPDLSSHLRSRIDVGKTLLAGPVPATVLRAAMIIGSGSASFEILRYLVDRLPFMITPRWVRTESQPIAVSNVLGYLLGCLGNSATYDQTFDIGGPDVLTYQNLFDIYAEEAGLGKRLVLPVPFLTPTLSSYWINFVTPLPASLARPLIHGLRNRVVCTDNRIRKIIPQTLLTCHQAVSLALAKIRQHQVDTCWSDAGPVMVPEFVACGDAPYSGGTVYESNYRVALRGTPDQVWDRIKRIGGETGWYFGNTLWQLRGLQDRLVGGVGLQRGRRDPDNIRVGDALDVWRVLAADPGSRLLLLAEMKLPGEAILEFQIRPMSGDVTELRQIARFLPRGVLGRLYWYTLVPVHGMLFKGMLRGIAKKMGSSILQGPEAVERTAPTCSLPGGV